MAKKAKKEPKQYFTAKGEPVPASAVSAFDKKRDKIVCKLVEEALKLSESLLEFKGAAVEKCDALYDENLEHKGVDIDLTKERQLQSYTMYSYDKKFKVEMNVSNTIRFNDNISIAQEKIQDYLDVATQDVNDDIRQIVRNAFTTRRNQLDKAKILSLFQYQITHPDWLQAMELIKASIEVADTKRYMQFSHRDHEGVYQPIQLNFSSL